MTSTGEPNDIESSPTQGYLYNRYELGYKYQELIAVKDITGSYSDIVIKQGDNLYYSACGGALGATSEPTTTGTLERFVVNTMGMLVGFKTIFHF